MTSLQKHLEIIFIYFFFSNLLLQSSLNVRDNIHPAGRRINPNR